jgi:hypothetical protein
MNNAIAFFPWIKRQWAAVSFDVWTKDDRKSVFHYAFRAVPTTLDCEEYEVKVVRSKMGGNSRIIRYSCSAQELFELQTRAL